MLPNKRKFNKKAVFLFWRFGRFLAKKQPKPTKNEENWQNSNRSVKFSEIWYVDASPQKEILNKRCFSILAFFGQKTVKIDKNEENWQKPNRLMKFGIEMLPNKRKFNKKTFFRFWPFLAKKTAKIDQK